MAYYIFFRMYNMVCKVLNQGKILRKTGSLWSHSTETFPFSDASETHVPFQTLLYYFVASLWVYARFYYTEESVLLRTKPLVDSIRHFTRDPSGVFSVCHLCECRIVRWRHDSRLLLLLNWFLHIIKRTLHVGSKIWILCSRGKNNISRVSEANEWDIVLATRT